MRLVQKLSLDLIKSHFAIDRRTTVMNSIEASNLRWRTYPFAKFYGSNLKSCVELEKVELMISRPEASLRSESFRPLLRAR